MMVYLDSNIVMYLVEHRPPWSARVVARIATIHAGGDTLAVSDLTRMECQVGPLKSGNAAVLADYMAFFALPTVSVLSLAASVYDRAARIRATYNLKALDSLHLATAAEHGCRLFLTNDAALARFPDVTVEVLT